MEPVATPTLKDRVVDVLKSCYDPEIPVNIWELGLIYNVDTPAADSVHVKMTLTSPHCPVAESLPRDIDQKIRLLDGVANVNVEVVWEPTWTKEMMSEAAKLQLNML